MALSDRLQHFLNEQRIGYEILPHREAFTAQEVAVSSHVPGRQLANVLLAREEGGSYLYGLPVYIDACFPRAQDFFFQAGNHHEVVRVGYREYEQAVRPVTGEFCLHESTRPI